jgi:exodeoxyribonuclease I
MNQTYLFYDIETTGLHNCFDQILQFAAIRTDLQLNELERHSIWVRLRPDVMPAPRAILTHQISLTHLAQVGSCEYEAVKQIHGLVNTPGTISLGYNSLDFDDDFLRFSFYRNLLPPYTHQYANGCGRMDLFPFTVIYFLYHKNALATWPTKPTGGSSLRLEDLSRANDLAADNAHDAMTDVEATLALARRFYASHLQSWEYICGYFNKTTEQDRLAKLAKYAALRLDDNIHPQAVLVKGKVGAKNNYQNVVLSLGNSLHYANQSLWLQLDNAALQRTTIESVADTAIFVQRKKGAGMPVLLPVIPRYLQKISDERQQTVQSNIEWLLQHPHILRAIINYHRHYKYQKVVNLDLDAALYENGFLSDSEQAACFRFHAATLEQKIAMLELAQFPTAKLRDQALRLLGRNYYAALPQALQQEFQHYLMSLEGHEVADMVNARTRAPAVVAAGTDTSMDASTSASASASIGTNASTSASANAAMAIMRDYHGHPRITRRAALAAIAECRHEPDVVGNDKRQALLDELDNYLRAMVT